MCALKGSPRGAPSFRSNQHVAAALQYLHEHRRLDIVINTLSSMSDCMPIPDPAQIAPFPGVPPLRNVVFNKLLESPFHMAAAVIPAVLLYARTALVQPLSLGDSITPRTALVPAWFLTYSICMAHMVPFHLAVNDQLFLRVGPHMFLLLFTSGHGPADAWGFGAALDRRCCFPPHARRRVCPFALRYYDYYYDYFDYCDVRVMNQSVMFGSTNSEARTTNTNEKLEIA